MTRTLSALGSVSAQGDSTVIDTTHTANINTYLVLVGKRLESRHITKYGCELTKFVVIVASWLTNHISTSGQPRIPLAITRFRALI